VVVNKNTTTFRQVLILLILGGNLIGLVINCDNLKIVL